MREWKKRDKVKDFSFAFLLDLILLGLMLLFETCNILVIFSLNMFLLFFIELFSNTKWGCLILGEFYILDRNTSRFLHYYLRGAPEAAVYGGSFLP